MFCLKSLGFKNLQTVIQMHQIRLSNFPEGFRVAVEMEINFRNYSKLTKPDCLSEFENRKIKTKRCLMLGKLSIFKIN